MVRLSTKGANEEMADHPLARGKGTRVQGSDRGAPGLTAPAGMRLAVVFRPAAVLRINSSTSTHLKEGFSGVSAAKQNSSQGSLVTTNTRLS